jgi:hypothetical protein
LGGNDGVFISGMDLDGNSFGGEDEGVNRAEFSPLEESGFPLNRETKSGPRVSMFLSMNTPDE